VPPAKAIDEERSKSAAEMINCFLFMVEV